MSARLSWGCLDDEEECPEGGCTNASEIDGYEHAPYRCDHCVLCGACGMVLQRPPRRGARDAPRFWSRLDAPDGVVTSLMVMQRRAAWRTYAELEVSKTGRTQQLADGGGGGDALQRSEGEEEVVIDDAHSRDGQRAVDEQQPRVGGQAGGSAGGPATPSTAERVKADKFTPGTAPGLAQGHHRGAGAAAPHSRLLAAQHQLTESPVQPRRLFGDGAAHMRSQPAENPGSAMEEVLPAWLQEAQQQLAATQRPAMRRAPAHAVPLGTARPRTGRARVKAFFAAARVLGQQQRPPLPGQEMAEEGLVCAAERTAVCAAATAEEAEQAGAAASVQRVWRWRRRQRIAATAAARVAEVEASAAAALASVEADAEQAMAAVVAAAAAEAEAAVSRVAAEAEETMAAEVAVAAGAAARATEAVAAASQPDIAAPSAEKPAMWDAVFAEQAWLTARFGEDWPQRLERNLQQSRRLLGCAQNQQKAREIGRALVCGWREQERELQRQGLRLPLGRGSGGRQQRRSRSQRQRDMDR